MFAMQHTKLCAHEGKGEDEGESEGEGEGECKLMKVLALNQQTASLKGLSLHKESRDSARARHLESSNS